MPGNGAWVQIGQDIYGEAPGDQNGYSISLSSDGTIVAIGAIYNDGGGSNSGHVRVYQYSSGSWTQLGQDIDGGGLDEDSGYSVSLSSDGTIVAIGAPEARKNGEGSEGLTRVYRWNGTDTWTQIGEDIHGQAITDDSGAGVGLSSDGTILVVLSVGGYQSEMPGMMPGMVDPMMMEMMMDMNEGKEKGKVKVYKIADIVTPTQDEEVIPLVYTPLDVAVQLGEDIDGEAADDYSGQSVSLSSDGTIVAIGAPYNADGGDNSGHVRVYQWNGTASTHFRSEK